jgi:hypothetical protein
MSAISPSAPSATSRGPFETTAENNVVGRPTKANASQHASSESVDDGKVSSNADGADGADGSLSKLERES